MERAGRVADGLDDHHFLADVTRRSQDGLKSNDEFCFTAPEFAQRLLAQRVDEVSQLSLMTPTAGA